MTVTARRSGLAKRLVRAEVGVWQSLALWVLRRRPGQGAGVHAFPYARDVTPLLWAFVFASALELPVLHFLLPWPTVKLVALVLGLWGLLWVLGYLAGMRVFPHLVAPAGLRVRSGPSVDVLIPWGRIAKIALERDRVSTNAAVQFEVEGDGATAVAKVAVLKQTRVRIELVGPTVLDFPDGPAAVEVVKIYADRPRELVAAAREQLDG